MNQLDLSFDSPLDTKPFVNPRARKSDPETSHEAARKHAESGEAKKNRERCLDGVYALTRGKEGPTAGEVWKWIDDPKISFEEVCRRLSDCRLDGELENEEPRYCPVRKKRCQTWVPKVVTFEVGDGDG